MVQHMDAVGALRGLPIMHNVGDEVVGGVGVRSLHLLRQVFPQIHVPGDLPHPQGGTGHGEPPQDPQTPPRCLQVSPGLLRSPPHAHNTPLDIYIPLPDVTNSLTLQDAQKCSPITFKPLFDAY